MDFISSAVIMVPTLTGMDLTVYDGTPGPLREFETKYCFSPELQPVYTQNWLPAFLERALERRTPEDCSPKECSPEEHSSEERTAEAPVTGERASETCVYDIEESLGTRLAAVKAGDCWVLLGPYVEEGWSESAARTLLTRLGASESEVLPYKAYRCKLPIISRDYAVKTALLVAENTGGGESRQVKPLRIDAGLAGRTARQTAALTIPDAYHDASLINRRYALEDRFIAAISRGETEAAMEFLDRFHEVSSDLRFMSNELSDHVAGAAIIRTLVRIGARQAGMSAVSIDSISQEYAQKMKHTASTAQLGYLQRRLVEHFCAAVRAMRESQYSPCVRRAVDYIAANLSQPLTIAEIARAAGTDRHLLTQTFVKETGMTVKRFLAKRRCELAEELLRTGVASVQEVAAYVGYPDNNYFSKVFKTCQGVSPQSCRGPQSPS